jgi:murein DD-endopeptidase MepM/ murein hydrolase activator NlpD
VAWYDSPTTQAHGVAGEQGIDIGTPFHSRITEVDPGQVDVTQYGPFGGLVGVQTARGQEYYLHLDEIDVAKGQKVSAGQTVGLSGGQLSGGQHPASPAFSTGPHTEFGIFSGPLFGSSSIDPTGIIAALRGGQDPAQAVGGIPGLPDPSAIVTSIGHGLADGIAASLADVAAFFKRQIIALAVAVVVAIVLFA